MSKKILLIEDDLDIQRIYTEKLKNKGYEIVISVNSDLGLQYAREENPDLILLDVMLPGKMNGFEILENLKKDSDLEKIPVIILTNLDTEKDQALKMGAIDYLIKANISLNDLVEKVQNIVG